MTACGSSALAAPPDFTAGPLVPAGGTGWTIALADMDADGDVDVVSHDRFSLVSVLVNDGTGGYALLPPFDLLAAGAAPSSDELAVGDMDGDGDPDVVLRTLDEEKTFEATIAVIRNAGDGTLELPSFVPVGFAFGMVSLGDIDDDGDLDVLTQNSATDDAPILTNDGAGGLTVTDTLSVGEGPLIGRLVDLDGDGDLDAAVANWDSQSVSLRRNLGGGAFGSIATVPLPFSPTALTFGDLDGDGDADLLATGFATSDLVTRMNNGTGAFSGGATWGVQGAPGSIDVADFDGDGMLDVAVSNRLSDSVTILWNRGDGSFDLPVTNIPTAPLTDPQMVRSTDVDGDGDLDLVVCSALQQSIVVLRSDLTTPCPADLDGSGAVDFTDLLSVLGAWGPCDAPCPEDFDDSGAVGLADLLVVLASWGPC